MPGDVNLIDVRDVADGIMSAIDRGESGEAYLLVNENWTIRELMNFLGQIHDRRPPRFRVPYSLALGFAYLEEAVCRFRRNGTVPMATVTGIKLTKRCFRFDGHALTGEARHRIDETLRRGHPGDGSCRSRMTVLRLLRTTGQRRSCGHPTGRVPVHHVDVAIGVEADPMRAVEHAFNPAISRNRIAAHWLWSGLSPR